MGKARGCLVQLDTLRVGFLRSCSMHHLSGVMISRDRNTASISVQKSDEATGPLCSTPFEGYSIRLPGKALSSLKGPNTVWNCPNSQGDTEGLEDEVRGPRSPGFLWFTPFSVKLQTFKIQRGRHLLFNKIPDKFESKIQDRDTKLHIHGSFVK